MIALAHPFRGVSPSYVWEECYPFVFGGIVFIGVMAYGKEIGCLVSTKHIDLGNVYTAVAGIFAVITGFAATFYGSIQSIADTRLQRIAKTKVFLRFLRYIKIATKWGFAIAILSIPFIILTPSTDISWISRLAVAGWCGACVFGFSAFLRVAGMLFFIFEYKPPEDEGAH